MHLNADIAPPLERAVHAAPLAREHEQRLPHRKNALKVHILVSGMGIASAGSEYHRRNGERSLQRPKIARIRRSDNYRLLAGHLGYAVAERGDQRV